MIIKKIRDDLEFSYKCFDEETEHHILLDDEFEDWECDYIDNDSVLLTQIFYMLDNDTELFITKAKDVAWSPYKEWYFIY